MTVTVIRQLFMLLACLLTIGVWLYAGRIDQRVVYIRWLVISPSALTAIFYGALVFTSWPNGDVTLANLLAGMIDIYTQVLFLATGVVVLQYALKSRKP